MACTRSSVCTEDGLESGTTVIVAVSPPLLGAGGVAATTPSRPLICFSTSVKASFGASLPFASTTTISGPLKPGPKPSESRS
ncbi:hypothetical protein STENM223S_05420 [Streptomyces tendae]